MSEMTRPTELSERPLWPAILNGLMCKCPKCGKAWLFHHYLEQVDHCPNCGEPLARYQVGLFLPLVVMTIVIHVIAFAMLDMELEGTGSPLTYLLVIVPLCIIIPLAIMPPCKGAIIGLFWAKNWSDVLER